MTTTLRVAVRSLARRPSFALLAIGAIALGISANSAIFTVIRAVLLRPLPFQSADRIVNIGRPGGGSASVPMFVFWRQNNPGFEDLTASLPANNMNLSGADKPDLVAAMRVSRNYFHLFGARPVLGRTFSSDEDRPGGERVAIIAYSLWQRRFGADPKTLGRTVLLGGSPCSIVGVLSPGFVSYPVVEAWLPLQADDNSADAAHILRVSARLPRGTTPAQANAWMAAVGKRYLRALAPRLIVGRDDQLQVLPMHQQLTGDIRPSLLILMGAVALVLLIACANVANLLLARAVGRRREIAIRAAIGAGRGRIVRQLLTESLVLAGAGGLVGLALGAWGVRLLIALTPGDLPRAQEMAAGSSLDPWVAGFTLLLTIATGVLFGLFPALQISRVELSGALKESGGRAGAGLRQNRLRGLLVAAEVAIAVVLLSGAVLLLRSFAAMHAASLGFDPHNLLTMEVSLSGPRYAHPDVVDRIARRFVERAQRIPGVEQAAWASALPLFGEQDMLISIPGQSLTQIPGNRADVQWRIVSPGYFDVLRIPLIAGRFPREQEPSHTAVISQALARKYFPHADPVGQTIVVGSGLGPGYESGATEIIGVAGDVRERLDQQSAPVVYQTPAQVLEGAMALVNRLDPGAVLVRTRPGILPMSVSEPVRQALLETDDLPAARIRTMDQVGVDSTARKNFNLLLLALFGAMALVLAATGIYGVMSYSVEERTHEIGIRAALGASRRDTLRLILRQALRMAAIGIAAGLAASMGLTRLIQGQLFGVQPGDPLTFMVTAAILLAIALAAALLPALRATRVDPMQALRAG